jgi:hypothetical protein
MASPLDTTGLNGHSPNTRVAISQKNRIYHAGNSPNDVNKKDRQIGVLSTFRHDETRTVDPVRGVGFGDRIAELVPGITEPMGISFTRTMLYTQGIVQALGYKGGIDGIVRSLRQHRWPFDIQTELLLSEIVEKDGTAASRLNPGGLKALSGLTVNKQVLITKFWTCWLENYSVDYPSESAIVVEEASGKATDVTDGSAAYDVTTYEDTGNKPA